MKEAAELFRRATPGRHVIVDQIAEGDRVVTRIRGYGKHTGDHLGVPASGNDVEVEGVAIQRVQDGKITEHWAPVDMAAFLQQAGVLPSPEMPQKEGAIRAFCDARARHDHEALRPLVTEDIVFHEPGAEGYSGDYHGPTLSSATSIGCSSRR